MGSDLRPSSQTPPRTDIRASRPIAVREKSQILFKIICPHHKSCGSNPASRHIQMCSRSCSPCVDTLKALAIIDVNSPRDTSARQGFCRRGASNTEWREERRARPLVVAHHAMTFQFPAVFSTVPAEPAQARCQSRPRSRS